MRGRKKKPPLLSDHLGGELAAQAFSNELIPGRVLGLWYDNDDKYHEFLLLYPGPGTGWAGLTPDGDRLEEKVMCDDPGNSCSRAFVCDDMGNGPPEARGKFYRFGDYPSDDAFKDHLKRARAEMRADALTQGLDAPADPKEALTLLGEKVNYHTLVPQVDLSNLAMGEAIFRRAQTIEWAYHDKLRDMESAAPKERLSPEELSAFSGLDRTGDHLMVAPSLLDHVKGVVEKDAAIMKNIRKAKEEREARKGKKENR